MQLKMAKLADKVWKSKARSLKGLERSAAEDAKQKLGDNIIEDCRAAGMGASTVFTGTCRIVFEYQFEMFKLEFELVPCYSRDNKCPPYQVIVLFRALYSCHHVCEE